MKLRQLKSIEDYHRVYELEHAVWGYTSSEDAVPVPIIVVTQKVGGLLLGAFDESDRLVGFAYSIPGIRDGKPFQWSHMVGVVEACRSQGTGWELKVAQRNETLKMGLDLIEWTFDPLQAMNAHLNFVKLGAVVREYHENVYGDSSSPLHRGTPTDRFIAEWWLRSARVQERLEAVRLGVPVSPEVGGSAPVNEVGASGDWLQPGPADLSLDANCLAVTIPTGFTEMQQHDPALARAWRFSTREIFTAYLPRGYEVVDFVLERPRGRGRYLLTRAEQG